MNNFDLTTITAQDALDILNKISDVAEFTVPGSITKRLGDILHDSIQASYQAYCNEFGASEKGYLEWVDETHKSLLALQTVEAFRSKYEDLKAIQQSIKN